MSESDKSQLTRSDVRVQKAGILAFWVIAFVVWWASLWHADLYSNFGPDLPDLTKTIFWSARVGLPFIFAAIFSVTIVYRMRKSGHRSISTAAWLLVASILLSSIAMLGMTLPAYKLCGEIVPGWPSSIEGEFRHPCGG